VKEGWTMANRLEATILINKPAEDIFAFLNVPENHPKFVPGMLEFKKTSPGPLGQVGATIRGVRQFLGQKMELPYEITEYEPGNRLGMKGAVGPITFKDGYVLERMGNSTLVKFWLELTLTGLMKLAKPFIVLLGETHAAETLANLKSALEKAG
jgi:carbon monoxide dehydrogenase subunit G